MIIGIPIYEKVDLLDVCAEREIFYSMAKTEGVTTQYDLWLLGPTCDSVPSRATTEGAPPQYPIPLLGPTCDSVHSRDGLTLTPQKTFDDVPELDMIWV